MKCPKCNKENDDNWILYINGVMKTGVCQECWETECSKGWWKELGLLDKLLNQSIKES